VRVAIVTGGSRGIGRAVATRLAGDGVAVVVGYESRKDEAEQCVKQIMGAGGTAVAIAGDIADHLTSVALFDAAEAEFGGCDILVHAAAVMMPPAPLAEIDLAALEQVHKVNVLGSFAILKEAAARIRDGGAIITLSSSVIGLALPGYGGYASSKAAVESLNMILARELRGRDITVNSVAPGATATELFFEGKTASEVEAHTQRSPLERLGKPEDIAELVAKLCESTCWVNGQTVRANGGTV